MFLIVGLGNPGKTYSNNRHNIGYRIIDNIRENCNFPKFIKKFNSEFSKSILGEEIVLLVKPRTYMNNSGKAVKEIKTGLVEIKNDKDGNLASTIGRKSYTTEKLLENYNHFIDSLKKEKPDTIKGEFIKNIFLTSSMGISYKIGAK